MSEDVNAVLLGVAIALAAACWALLVAWLVWRTKSKDP